MSDDINNQLAFDHAWRYFELHAQQRITVFNFFLAISGLVSAGVGVCLQQGTNFSLLASLLGVFLILVSFIFWKLDQRVSEMIKLAESAICQLEATVAGSNMLIFTKDRQSPPTNGLFAVWTYGRCFRVSFLTVSIVGLAFAIIPHLVDFSSKPSEVSSPYKRVCEFNCMQVQVGASTWRGSSFAPSE